MPRLRLSKLTLLYLAFWVVCFWALKPGLLILDGLAYYSYLPSLFLDNDLNFWNEFEAGGVFSGNVPSGRGITATGYVSNHWSIGPATVWWPFWLMGHLLTSALHLFPLPKWPLNGFSVYYNIGVRFATALLAFSAMVLCYNSFRPFVRYHLVSSLLLVAVGTPFYWYTFLNADTSHVPAAFAIALFLSIWLVRRQMGPSLWFSIGLGLSGGLAMLIRIQDALVFLFILVLWLDEFRSAKTTLRKVLKEFLLISFTALFVFGVQLIVWKILFGTFLGPLQARVPFQNGSNFYYLFTGHFYAYEVFFSSYHGLFFFTPLLFFCLAGLIAGLRSPDKRAISAASLIILSLQIFLMCNERWFWEGTSFGMRRLVDWTPLFIFGLTTLFDVIPRRWIRISAGLAAFWCVLLQWTYSARPMSVLFDYQPPSVIFRWLAETVSNSSSSLIAKLVPGAPIGIYFIGLIFFGTIAYFIFSGIVRFVKAFEEGKKKVVLTGFVVLTGMIAVMYCLTAIAFMNGERSKSRYARELSWLQDRTESSFAKGIAEHVFSEAKFLAQFKGWDQARDSFRECMKISPEPERMRQRISLFVRGFLPETEAQRYLASF